MIYAYTRLMKVNGLEVVFELEVKGMVSSNSMMFLGMTGQKISFNQSLSLTIRLHASG